MNFEELGLTLRREREKKGLSVELVMEATKISRTNIVAMEEGNRSALPHSVYAKGFIKSYARYLGLDADELSMIIDREFVEEAEGQDDQFYDVAPVAEKAFQGGDAPVAKSRSVLPMLLVAVLLIAVVVLLLMNLNANNSDDVAEPVAATQSESQPDVAPAPIVPEAVEEQPVMEESDAATTPAIEDEVVDKAPEPVAEAVKEVVKEAVPAAAPVVVAVEPQKPAPAPEKKVEPQPEKAPVAESKPVKQKYDHVLIIRAITDKGCWIGVWRGDETKMARDFVLKQGEPLRLMFNSARRIRIGNVAGVSVSYNGKPYSLENAKGNIQTLRFGTE